MFRFVCRRHSPSQIQSLLALTLDFSVLIHSFFFFFQNVTFVIDFFLEYAL